MTSWSMVIDGDGGVIARHVMYDANAATACMISMR
jgi:hypothetical protein